MSLTKLMLPGYVKHPFPHLRPPFSLHFCFRAFGLLWIEGGKPLYLTLFNTLPWSLSIRSPLLTKIETALTIAG